MSTKNTIQQVDELNKYKKAAINVCNISNEELVRDSEILGAGSVGRIRRAKYHGMQVVCKDFITMPSPLTNYRDLIGLYNCKCPNITFLIGAGPDIRNGQLDFIVIEYAENSSLFELMKAEHVSYGLSHFFLWMLQAANGLDYMSKFESKPMLHRDVKPSNMLLFDHCRILKLSDFGTARLEGAQLTELQGTRNYMAPEVRSAPTFPNKSNDSCIYSTKIDIYSLCGSLWSVLTRVPYEGSYKPIVGCPSMLSLLIESGLSDDPRKRPSAEEIVDFADFAVNNISLLKRSECGLDFTKEDNCFDPKKSSTFPVTPLLRPVPPNPDLPVHSRKSTGGIGNQKVPTYMQPQFSERLAHVDISSKTFLTPRMMNRRTPPENVDNPFKQFLSPPMINRRTPSENIELYVRQCSTPIKKPEKPKLFIRQCSTPREVGNVIHSTMDEPE